MRFPSLRLLGVVAVVAATLAPGASALAADPQAGSPGEAVPLDRKLSGHLNPGGGFAFYRFYYPADGSVATVNLDIMPSDPFILQNTGFHIYSPSGKLVVTGGAQPGSSPVVTANVIDSDPAMKGDYTVQLYDYDPARSVDFAIWPAGSAQPPMTASPAPASQPAAAPAATQPAPAATTQPAAAPSQAGGVSGEALTGHLAPGGNFAQYEFTYPGDSSTYTLNMRITPEDSAVLNLAGFEVYGPDGALVVKGGAQPGLAANVSANVISTLPGRYMVKVYNYHPTAAIDYSVVLVTSKPTTAAV